MKKISDLFQRFNNFIPPERIIKNAIIESVFIKTRINIEGSALKIEKSLVRINTSPVIKTKILMKKLEILELLEEKLGNKSPKEII